MKVKMKVKRLELGTHFGGANRLKTSTEEFRKLTIDNILKCVDGVAYMNLPYTNGVYLVDNHWCYVVLDGVTYDYSFGKRMFRYYLSKFNNEEIVSSFTNKEKSNLLSFENHPLITQKQLEIVGTMKEMKRKKERKLENFKFKKEFIGR